MKVRKIASWMLGFWDEYAETITYLTLGAVLVWAIVLALVAVNNRPDPEYVQYESLCNICGGEKCRADEEQK